MTRPMTGQPETHDELHAANVRANVAEHREQQAAGITNTDVMAVVYQLDDIDGVLMPFGDTLEAITSVERAEMDEVAERIEAAGFEVLGELDPGVYDDQPTAYLRIAVEGGEGEGFDFDAYR